MKEIKIGHKEHTALVDDEDFDRLNQFNWHVKYVDYTWYAARFVRIWRKCYILVYMHREIMQTPRGVEVDHKNRKGYDNRKENLRNCTKSQNMQNQMVKTDHPKGVSFNKLGIKSKKWVMQISKDGVRYREFFATSEEAARAYNDKAKELFGEFARLNIIEDTL